LIASAFDANGPRLSVSVKVPVPVGLSIARS